MTSPACIFCKILNKELPAKIAYEDSYCVAFHDINPQSPVHLLVIPRKHFASAEEAEEADEPILGHLHRVAAQLAREHHLTHGYRVVLNTGPGAGRSGFLVPH